MVAQIPSVLVVVLVLDTRLVTRLKRVIEAVHAARSPIVVTSRSLHSSTSWTMANDESRTWSSLSLARASKHTPQPSNAGYGRRLLRIGEGLTDACPRALHVNEVPKVLKGVRVEANGL